MTDRAELEKPADPELEPDPEPNLEPGTGTEPEPEPEPGWWRRHWRAGAATLTALAGLAVLAFGPAGVAQGIYDYTQRRAAAAAESAHLPGTEVRDGPVSFVVHVVHCGKTESKSGHRCEVTVGARNDGPAEVTIPGAAQRLRGSEGARHNPVRYGDPAPFGTLRPGQAATAIVRFNVPRHSTVTHVEVHSGDYTRGQAVRLLGPPLPLR